jgi:hypothetical protein
MNIDNDTRSSQSDARQLLRAFRSMYVAKRFERYLFDTDQGYLQTTLSDDSRMPLDFFIEYNNAWWFPILDKVAVPCIAYDPETESGTIVLAIHYTDKDILHAAQHVKFRENRISYIRTYASSVFFSRDDDLIQLDNFGNAIWLSTGYGLRYSAQAALLFFESPKGQSFAKNDRTRRVVQEIKGNVMRLLESLPAP